MYAYTSMTRLATATTTDTQVWGSLDQHAAPFRPALSQCPVPEAAHAKVAIVLCRPGVLGWNSRPVFHVHHASNELLQVRS